MEEPHWNKSITLPYRCDLGMFLERKSFTGSRSMTPSERFGVSAVPQCLQWTVEEVADWVESLGFKDYRVRV